MKPPGFDEVKATQIAARFLAASGKRMPYISLIKLMYFLDREALKRWGSPVSYDAYYSMKWGPILSNTLDLMQDESQTRGFWSLHISSPSNYIIELIDETGNDRLSKAEEALIDEIHAQYGRHDRWELVEMSHALKEWTPTDRTSIPLKVSAIMKALGKSDDEADAIERELQGYAKMRAFIAGQV